MSEQEKKQILELLGMVIDSIHVITERTQRTTEAEIEDVTKRYGTKHSAAKPTRNNATNKPNPKNGTIVRPCKGSNGRTDDEP